MIALYGITVKKMKKNLRIFYLTGFWQDMEIGARKGTGHDIILNKLKERGLN